MDRDEPMSDDGGPAFPTQISNRPDRWAELGMTLRDYFAAVALQGMISSEIALPKVADLLLLAESAYAAADAMLAERAK